ncbi:MAG: hypothetical protein ACUVQD_04705, partial [Thermaceae bacterium]
ADFGSVGRGSSPRAPAIFTPNLPVAVLIPPDEKLKTTAEIVRVRMIEKPLTRDKLLSLLN